MNRLIWFFLTMTRLRDRLRCPQCKAVGTYKLHAPTSGKKGRPWRWLCKCCGWYEGSVEKGEPIVSGHLCYPSDSKRVWAFRTDNITEDKDKSTPYEFFIESKVWPWSG